jgi:hypothetical protein
MVGGGILKLPDRKDLLNYAEGTAQEAAIQKQILQLLASSPIIREQLADLKKDLYLVSTQVPEYKPDLAFASELTRLAQAWLKLSYDRQFSVKKFHRSKEFFHLMLILAGALLFLIGMIGLHLLK